MSPIRPVRRFALFAAAVLATGAMFATPSVHADERSASREPAARSAAWESFVTADQLAERMRAEPDLVVIDARSRKEYAAGHVPGAISLPGADLRTPEAKPGEGESQYIFRVGDDPAGEPDVALYEEILGNAGLTRDAAVVVYGGHAGRADGSVPAMLLDWLGQREVAFLDGVGAEQWTAAGHELSTEPTVPSPAEYVARPRPNVVWNLPAVLANVGKPGVVFYDTRSPAEFAGDADEAARRGNKHPGRIPGAVPLDYASFLADNKTVLPPAELKAELARHGVTPDKTVVLYCQTATRVSLPYLVLKDLGYDKVAVYDASWHEYGNRDDTPKETGTAPRRAGAAPGSGSSGTK